VKLENGHHYIIFNKGRSERERERLLGCEFLQQIVRVLRE
jgi:hypothetical protein